MAIKDLDRLLREMNPELVRGNFVFLSVSEESFSKIREKVIFYFLEKEGISVVLEKNFALRGGFELEEVWSMITLNVNSDLTAVGFLARITNILAENNISVNAVSAYHHDHLFVLDADAKKTMDLLRSFSN